ncbi:uncharacterized protein LOC143854779 [Tasmannia lanceolata]|uniref:uncharacterized protein LOC143854779 n=1 Tax=Tasmannia lanceolata TaxID=3420 RepID=UPI004063E55D
MKEGTEVMDHLNAYNKIICQLSNIDVEIDDEDKALILLTSLPPSYEYLVTTLLYGKDIIELEEVTTTLLSIEMRKRPTSEKHVEGLVAKVLMGNNNSCKTVGMGTMNIKIYDGTIRTLTGVRHVPELKKNLISLGALNTSGCRFTGDGGTLKVVKGSLVVMKANMVKNHLYELMENTVQGLRELSKRNLLKGVKSCKLDFCEHYVFGKQCRRKSEVFSTFKQWKTMIEKQTGKKVKCLRTDNGGEYKSSEFIEICKGEGIIVEEGKHDTGETIEVEVDTLREVQKENIQVEFSEASLHENLEEEMYIHQPEGFKVEGKEDHVCKLKKSLYGLEQSPRQWYKRFDHFMIGQGFHKSEYDSCVYFKNLGNGSIIILILYVDDMLIAAKSMLEINKLKAKLSKEFEIKDLVIARKILGMEIR